MPGGGDNGSTIPFDAPSNVSFLGTRLMVANQAFVSGDKAHHAILDVEAGEEGLPELIPPAPRVDTPPVATPKPKAKKRWSCRRYRTAKKRRSCRRTLAKRRARRERG